MRHLDKYHIKLPNRDSLSRSLASFFHFLARSLSFYLLIRVRFASNEAITTRSFQFARIIRFQYTTTKVCIIVA